MVIDNIKKRHVELRYVIIAVLICSLIAFAYITSVYYTDRLAFTISLENYDEYCEIQQLIEKSDFLADYSVSSLEKLTIETSTKRLIDANLIYASAGWFRINQQRLICGRFFENEEDNYIVLEKETAIQLFTNEDCLLETLFVNGEEYIVCGIYEQSKNPLKFLSFYKGYEGFVPIKYSASNEFVFEAIANEDAAEFLVNDIKSRLGKQILSESYPFILVDDIKYWIKLFSSIIFIMIYIKWFKHSILICKKKIEILKEKRKKEYLKYWISSNLTSLVIIAVVIMSNIIALVVFIFLLFPYPNIPYDILPNKLIDCKEWIENIKYSIEQENTAMAMNYGVNKLLLVARNIVIVCGVLLCYIVWKVVYKIKHKSITNPS